MYNRNNNASMKPEYVLKRVNDLINSAVGSNAEKEKKLALEQLHNVIGSNRKGMWTKAYEPLMKKHIELCVDLKDHHTAKDGLHQYRNFCQAEPSTLESVIVFLMDLSESRATAAREKADKVALAAAARISDLEQEETSESIMLSSMTEEGAKGRTDREVVVPWLKFLWETYRAILELLYKIPKLEKVYHRTCEKAFKFCQDYSRLLEFRRLCEMLRSQLTNLQKTQATGSRNARPQWEWTPEIVEYHLQTRFSQLEVATSLELWNEGFRTVEDIYGIMVASKRTPKARLMMTYYEKLARIFWVSENKLFHAYAWYRYYCLYCDSSKDLKQEDKSTLASLVLLSALTVPSMKAIQTNPNQADDDEVVIEKNSPMALLLDFQSNPSRQSLLAELCAKGIIDDVSPEIANLYDNLEVKFQPLGLIKNVKTSIDSVKAHPKLSIYAGPLQRVVVVKVMQQLSKVYSNVRLSFVHKIFAGLEDLNPNLIEKILIEGVSQNQLQLKIDHRLGAVKFAAPVGSSDGSTDIQVAQLGAALSKVSTVIASLVSPTSLAEKRAEERKAFFAKVAQAAEEEYVACMERKMHIERRKEGLELLQQEKQKEVLRLKEIEEANRLKDEKERLELEEAQRNLEKRRKMMEKLELVRVQKELEKHGVFMEESAIAELDTAQRQSLILEAQTETMKAKEEEVRRTTEQARRLDHITRALRIEAAKVIPVKYAAQLVADKKVYDEKRAETIEMLKKKHEQDLLEKKRMEKMQSVRPSFEEVLLKKQKGNYARYIQDLRKKEKAARIEAAVEKARSLYYEECAKIEAEEQRIREIEAKAERDRLEREQHERLRKQREEEEEMERARHQKLMEMQKQIEEDEKRRAEERRKQDEQLKDEQELKRKELAEKASRPSSYVPPSARKDEGGWEKAGGNRRDAGPADSGGAWRGSRVGPEKESDSRGGDRGFERVGPRGGGGGFERGGDRGGDRGFERGERRGGDRDFERGGDRGGDRRGGEGGGSWDRAGPRRENRDRDSRPTDGKERGGESGWRRDGGRDGSSQQGGQSRSSNTNSRTNSRW